MYGRTALVSVIDRMTNLNHISPLIMLLFLVFILVQNIIVSPVASIRHIYASANQPSAIPMPEMSKSTLTLVMCCLLGRTAEVFVPDKPQAADLCRSGDNTERVRSNGAVGVDAQNAAVTPGSSHQNSHVFTPMQKCEC